MPEVPKLNSCCFFITLETGTKIIAWVTAIIGGFEFLGYLIELIRRLGDKNSDIIFDITVKLIVALLLTLLGIYLLIGVYKNQPSYVRLWVTVATIFLLILLIQLIIVIVRWITGHAQPDFIISIVQLILCAYFILVVNSYLREQGGGGVDTF